MLLTSDPKSHVRGRPRRDERAKKGGEEALFGVGEVMPS